MPKSRAPAIKNRTPAKRNGGSSPTPMRIARYVEPQTVQTRRYATSALPFNAAMSIGLHRLKAGLLEQGRQDDGRPSRERLLRPAQAPQHLLDALQVRCSDLQDVAVVARD